MTSALKIYKTGSLISAVFVMAAIGLDFKSERDSERKIAALKTPVMDRFAECQIKGCATNMRPFLACIEAKADAITNKTNAITVERKSDRALIRSTMVLGLTIFSFFALMAWTEPKPVVKPPQPR